MILIVLLQHYFLSHYSLHKLLSGPQIMGQVLLFYCHLITGRHRNVTLRIRQRLRVHSIQVWSKNHRFSCYRWPMLSHGNTQTHCGWTVFYFLFFTLFVKNLKRMWCFLSSPLHFLPALSPLVWFPRHLSCASDSLCPPWRSFASAGSFLAFAPAGATCSPSCCEADGWNGGQKMEAHQSPPVLWESDWPFSFERVRAW